MLTQGVQRWTLLVLHLLMSSFWSKTDSRHTIHKPWNTTKDGWKWCPALKSQSSSKLWSRRVYANLNQSNTLCTCWLQAVDKTTPSQVSSQLQDNSSCYDSVFPSRTFIQPKGSKQATLRIASIRQRKALKWKQMMIEQKSKRRNT